MTDTKQPFHIDITDEDIKRVSEINQQYLMKATDSGFTKVDFVHIGMFGLLLEERSRLNERLEVLEKALNEIADPNQSCTYGNPSLLRKIARAALSAKPEGG